MSGKPYRPRRVPASTSTRDHVRAQLIRAAVRTHKLVQNLRATSVLMNTVPLESQAMAECVPRSRQMFAREGLGLCTCFENACTFVSLQVPSSSWLSIIKACTKLILWNVQVQWFDCRSPACLGMPKYRRSACGWCGYDPSNQNSEILAINKVQV